MEITTNEIAKEATFTSQTHVHQKHTEHLPDVGITATIYRKLQWNSPRIKLRDTRRGRKNTLRSFTAAKVPAIQERLSMPMPGAFRDMNCWNALAYERARSYPIRHTEDALAVKHCFHEK
jgi:hypothetical protein